MIGISIAGAALVTTLLEANKSLSIDEKTLQKNVRAFSRMADAEYKMEQSKRNLMDNIEANFKRKAGILNYHVRSAVDMFKNFETVLVLKKGEGIIELERIVDFQNKLPCYTEVLSIASRDMMKDSQLILSYTLMGIGGLMIQDSKMNEAVASQNLSRANVMKAQAETISLSLDGITERVEMITSLLNRMGMVMLGLLRQMKCIWETNGNNEERYTERDIEIINLTLDFTLVLYRIINLPILDENGKLVQESDKAIAEGNQYINKINKL